MGVINEDMVFNGAMSLRGPTSLPSGAVDNDDVAPDAGIEASKLEHQHHLPYSQSEGADVASATRPIYLAMAAGTLEAFEVCPESLPSGDHQYTVDLQKAANGSTSFVSVLTAVVTVDSGSAAGTLQAGSLATTDFADGDRLRIVVTASGTTGSQGQGMLAVLKLREAA